MFISIHDSHVDQNIINSDQLRITPEKIPHIKYEPGITTKSLS